MAVGDIWKLKVCCYSLQLGQIALNNVYYRTVSEVGVVPILANQAVATALDTLTAPVYKSWMSPSASYRGVSAQRLTTPLPTIALAQVGNDGIGSGGGSNLPAQDSGVVTLQTAFSSRHTRGRVYPGFPTTLWSNANGEMNAGGFAQLANIASVFATQLNPVLGLWSAVLEPAVRSRVINPLPAPPTISYNAVTAAVARERFATQRRRGQYGRLNPLPF